MIDLFVKRLSAPAALLAAIAWLTVPPTDVYAQGVQLSAELIRRNGPLNAEDVGAVTQYIAENSANLENSKEPLKIRADRVALLNPLMDAQCSIPFRLEFSKQLASRLAPLAESSDDIVAINAIVLCGNLASGPALDTVVKALDSQRAPIRYQAAFALARAFEVVKAGNDAVPDAQVTSIVNGLEARIAKEADALVFGELVRAGIAAAQINADEQARAVTAISKGVSQAVRRAEAKAVSDAHAEAFIQAAVAVRDILNRPLGPGGKLPPEAAKAAAALGGNLVGHAVRVVEKNGLPMVTAGNKPAPVRIMYADVVGASEAIFALAAPQLAAGAQFTGKSLRDSLAAGTRDTDAKFALDARSLVGVNGPLSKEPFGFPGVEFIR